ncbi:MAG: amidohydrolase family protein [Prochlorococcaceae cyanobacterium]|jgi:cytosine deaminase
MSTSSPWDPAAAPGRLELRVPCALLDPALPLPPPDPDGLVAVTLRLAAGAIRSIEPWDGSAGSGAVGGGAAGPELPLALTPLVEPHAHLDKAFSWEQHPNREGTIADALAANGREAAERTAERVRQRAERALQLGWRQGLRALRSHVDSLGAWSVPSWEALLQARRDWQNRLALELVALVPLEHWCTPEGEALAARVAAAGGLLGGVLGLPGQSGRQDGEALAALLQLAERHGCGIDLHIDECSGGGALGLRRLLHALGGRPAPVPITCSHLCSLGLLPEWRLRRLADRMAAAGLAVVALPFTNLWLQDRRPGCTPNRRPQAPVRQLQAAGVAVAIGGDNVQDPWFPGGNFDPIETLRFSVAASHQAPWQRQGLTPFTSEAARLLRLPWDGVLRPGAPADLVVLGAFGWSELLARCPERRVLRAGRWLPPLESGPAARSLLRLGA